MDRELKMYSSAYLEGMQKTMNIPIRGSLCLLRFYMESPRKGIRIETPSTTFLGFETEMHFRSVGLKN